MQRAGDVGRRNDDRVGGRARALGPAGLEGAGLLPTSGRCGPRPPRADRSYRSLSFVLILWRGRKPATPPSSQLLPENPSPTERQRHQRHHAAGRRRLRRPGHGARRPIRCCRRSPPISTSPWAPTSVIVTVYLLAHGSVQLVIGPIGDRFGKYLCVALAAAAATVMVALCGLAPSLPLLVAARLGSGLATGWIIPLALRLHRRRHPLRAPPAGARPLPVRADPRAIVRPGRRRRARRLFRLAQRVLHPRRDCSAIATLGLFYELWRNPITHASHADGAAGPRLHRRLYAWCCARPGRAR